MTIHAQLLQGLILHPITFSSL